MSRDTQHFNMVTMKELKKEMRMRRIEQEWLKTKAGEFKVAIMENRERLQEIRQEIQKLKNKEPS